MRENDLFYDGLSVYCAGDGNSTTVCDCDNHIDVESTDVISTELNPMMKMMVTKPLGNFLNLLSRRTKSVSMVAFIVPH